MALLRQHKQEQRCHGLRFFPSWHHLVCWILLTASATVATTTCCDGSHHCSRSRSSHSGRRCLIPATITTKQKRNILGKHNANSIITRFPRCCMTSQSSCFGCIRGFLPAWRTSATAAATTTTTTTKRAMLSFRGGSGGGGGDGIIVSGAKAIMASIGESKTKCWILLIVCILAETWATSLSKTARDEQSPAIFAASLVLYSACMLGFNVALSKIEVGIAYAVWSALGTLVVTYIGIVCFGESFDLYKLLCLSFIVIGVIGLNLREEHQ